MNGKKNTARFPSQKMRLAGLVATGTFALTLADAALAQTMSSTAELKLACETSPNNVVAINANTQISTGPQSPATELVNTKCTLVVAPLVTFEASQVSMTFRGPLVIQGGLESRALFIESTFAAPSISSSLGDKSLLLVERSLMQSTVGGIVSTSGAESIVDIRGPLVGGNLVSAGAVRLTGGQKFGAFLTDAEVRARTGIIVNMAGPEAQFISVTSILDTATGAINVSSAGAKALAEFKLGSVATGRGGINVTFSGPESLINANEFTFNDLAGPINLRANGAKSNVTAVLGTLNASGAVNIQASTASTEGSVLVQNALITAGGIVQVQSGALGKTEVLDSSLTSSTRVRITTGAGGVCTTVNNVVTAPIQQICP